MSCGHYDPHPAGFISPTNGYGVSTRVFACLFSVLYADSMPGISAGWFEEYRGWMRASSPTVILWATGGNMMVGMSFRFLQGSDARCAPYRSVRYREGFAKIPIYVTTSTISPISPNSSHLTRTLYISTTSTNSTNSSYLTGQRRDCKTGWGVL